MQASFTPDGGLLVPTATAASPWSDEMVNGHHIGGLFDPLEQLFAGGDRDGPVEGAAVGADLGVLRADVEGVLEDLDALAGVEGAPEAPDQLLRLA